MQKGLCGYHQYIGPAESAWKFSGANEIGGIIELEMERSQFAISEISRIVESNDCTILHLNTIVHPETGMLTVTLHINKKRSQP